MGASGPTKDQTHLRIRRRGRSQTRPPFLDIRRGAQYAPAGREVVGPYGRTGRFPHLVGAGALTRPPQRIPPTRRSGYQPPVSNRVPFTVGPVWNRPLRRSSDRFLHFRRGGTPDRPETARWGHRALQKIKRTSGYAVGAGPRPARRFWTYAGAHSMRPRAAEVVGPYGRTGRFPHLVGAGVLTRPPQGFLPLVGRLSAAVSNRVPFTVGPVSVRPLQRSPDRFLHFVGRHTGPPGNGRWGHRALQRSNAPPDTP